MLDRARSRRPASRSASRRSWPPSFPTGDRESRRCSSRSSRSTSSSGRLLFRHGLARSGELDARAAAAAGRRVESRAVSAHVRTSDGRIVAAPATGGVAVALDALMRERGGVWIAHGAGPADRAGRRRRDQVRVPPDEPVVRSCAGSGSRSRPSLRTTAASPTRDSGRCATWSTSARSSAPTTGPRTETSTLALPRPSTRSSATSEYAGLHPGLSPRARRPSAARAAAAGADGAVLAHSVAVSRSPAHLSVAARDPDGPARRTTCSRSSSNAIAATSCSPSRKSSTPRSSSKRLACQIRRSRAPRSCRCRSASTTIAFRRLPRTPSLASEQARLARLFDLSRRDHRHRRRSARLHQGHSRAPRRARRAADRAGPALRGQLTFVQIGVPSRSEIRELRRDRSRDRSDASQHINARHRVPGGAPPVSLSQDAR